MFILIYFLVVALSQFISNKALQISDENEDSYDYSKRDSIILAILFLLGIALQILSPRIEFMKSAYWYMCLIYFMSSLIIMIIFMTIKKSKIEKQHEEIQQIYEILQRMVDRKNEGLDFNNVPFTLHYKYGKINKIDVVVEPTSFDERTLPVLIQQLNNFLPTFTWNYELRLEERYMSFLGADKPPNIARWPGSWLRPLHAFPLGISGEGELIWQPDSANKKQLGRSLFLDQKGNPIKADISLSKAPQGLVAGGPLSLDTIIPTTNGYKTMKTIEVGDYVFDINNSPVKVLALSEITIPDVVYEMKLQKDNETMTIKGDKIHRFPTVVGEKIYLKPLGDIKVDDLIIDNRDYFNNKSWTVISKKEIKPEQVKCILVDSDSHLFFITDTKDKRWKGGNSYPYKKVLTRNTGGGKSVTIQDFIMHALEHRDEIFLACIDPKIVEFTNYKGMNGVVGVANTIEETVELLRIGKAVMHKRNRELAKLGCKQVAEYTPTDYSGKVFVTGREFEDGEQVRIREKDEEKTMTAGELADYLEDMKEVKVCLNGEDWIPINKNCCHKMYNDSMPMLLFIVDEMAELTTKSGLKTEEAKRDDSYKDEIVSIISSIAQLGRSAGIHVIVATQKPNASVLEDGAFSLNSITQRCHTCCG